MQVRFIGRVQGVGFRARARDIALSYPVSGWVRNDPDGSVVCQIQGDTHDVESCLGEIRQQMARNIVRSTESPLPEDHDEVGFEIQR